MAGTAITDSATRTLAREVASLRTEVDALNAASRTPQLGNSAIDNGSLAVKDANGTTRAVIGLQPDGTFTTTSVNNPVAPQIPAAPTVLGTKAGVQVSSHGPSSGVWPMDFAGLRVYVAVVGAPGTLAGTITPDPGVLPIAPLPYVTQRVWLTSINHSGAESAPSAEATATPAMVVGQDVLDGIVTTVKLADQAVAQAKIAVAAVGTGQIAGQAVTLSQLADGSVNAAKLLDGSVTPAKITFTARDIGSVANFYQATPPSSPRTGDLWVDTSTSANQLKQWNGSAWIVVQDATAALTAAQTAQTQAATAITAAAGAQATADGKVTTFYQATAPAAGVSHLGDLWLNTSVGNQLYRWSGTAWLLVQDAQITAAVAAAQTAQSTADGKIDAFYQTTAPTAGMSIGDLWYDTSNGNLASRWNGTSWVGLPVGTNALSAGAVTVPKIANGAVTGPAIAGSAVTTGAIAAGAVTANSIATNTITSGQIAADTITAGQISAGAIGASELAANSVIAGKIAASTITSTEIAARTIQAGDIAANTISATEIAARTITATQILAGTVTTNEIAANTITAGDIQAGSITADRLAATLVLASTLIAGSQNGARVQLNGAGIQAFRPDGTTKTLDFSTSTGNMVLAGQYRSGDSGEHIVINTDGTQQFFNSGGGMSGQIANNGNDLLTSGTLNGSSRTGAVNVSAAGAGITFRNPGSTTLYGELNVQQGLVQANAAVVYVHADQRVSPGNGTQRMQVSTLDTSGNEIASSVMNLVAAGGNGAILSPDQNAGIKFDTGTVLVVTGNGAAFGPIKATQFIPSSSETVKSNIGEVTLPAGRTSWDLIEGAPALDWDYISEGVALPPHPVHPDGSVAMVRVRNPAIPAAIWDTLMDYDPQKWAHEPAVWSPAVTARAQRRHKFPLAEDLHALCPDLVDGTLADPANLGVDLRDVVGILWDAVDMLIKRNRLIETRLAQRVPLLGLPARPQKGDMVAGAGAVIAGRTRRDVDAATGQIRGRVLAALGQQQ